MRTPCFQTVSRPAYRRERSNKTAILKVFSDIVDAIDNGTIAFPSQLDLTAAFDIVHLTTAPRDDVRLQLCHLNCDAFVHIWMTLQVHAWALNLPLREMWFMTCPRDASLGCCSLHRDQVYSSCLPSECTILKDKILDYTAASSKWLASSRLMLNQTRSEFTQGATSRRVSISYVD